MVVVLPVMGVNVLLTLDTLVSLGARVLVERVVFVKVRSDVLALSEMVVVLVDVVKFLDGEVMVRVEMYDVLVLVLVLVAFSTDEVRLVNVLCAETFLDVLLDRADDDGEMVCRTLVDVVVFSEVVVLRLISVLVDVEVITTVWLVEPFEERDELSVSWCLEEDGGWP